MASLRPPQIGEYTPQVPVEEGLRRVIPEQRGINIGSGLQELGAATQKIAISEAANYTMSALSQAQGQWTEQLRKAQESAPPGAPGFTPAFMDQYGKYAQDAVKNAPNDLARKMLTQHLTEFGNQLQTRAIGFEAASREQHNVDTATLSVQTAGTELLQHPEVFNQRLAERQYLIDSMNLNPAQKDKLQLYAKNEMAKFAALGAIHADPSGALEELKSDTPAHPYTAMLTPEVREQLMTYAERQSKEQQSAAKQSAIESHAQALEDTFHSQGQSVGMLALSHLDKDESVPEALRDGVRNEVERRVSQWRVAQRGAFEGPISALETQIASGNPPANARSQIDSLYEKGAFSPEQHTALLDGISRAQKKDDAQDGTLAWAEQAYNNRVALDPKDEKQRDAMNLYFRGATLAVPAGSDGYNNLAVQMLDRTGIIPKDAISYGRATLVGGDPKGAAAAAQLFQSLHDTNPAAYLLSTDEETRAMAYSVSSAVQAGTNPDVAVNLAREQQRMAASERETLQKKWDTLYPQAKDSQTLQTKDLVSLLSQDTDYRGAGIPHLLGFRPPGVPVPNATTAAPEALRQWAGLSGEFNALTKQYFFHTGGNLSQAETLAVRDLKGTWGVSEVNGSRELMKYAPERMFPGMTADMIRDDLKASGHADAHLIEAPYTGRSGGRSWNLAQKDQFGAWETVRDDKNMPVNYNLPDLTGELMQKHANEDASALLKTEGEQAATPEKFEQGQATAKLFRGIR